MTIVCMLLIAPLCQLLHLFFALFLPFPFFFLSSRYFMPEYNKLVELLAIRVKYLAAFHPSSCCEFELRSN